MLSRRNIGIVGEEFAVSNDGIEMFGAIDVKTTVCGCRFAIGIPGPGRPMDLIEVDAVHFQSLEARLSFPPNGGSLKIVRDLARFVSD